MKVYRAADREGFQLAMPVDSSKNTIFSLLERRPQLGSWTPIAMKFFPGEEADISWSPSGALILRRRAVDVLGSYLKEHGEFLPLSAKGGGIWAFHVLRAVDALDWNRSKIIRFPEGGEIVLIESHLFLPEMLENVLLFQLPQYPHGPTFLLDGFVELVNAAELRGLKFELLWDSETGPITNTNLQPPATGRTESLDELMTRDSQEHVPTLDDDLWAILCNRIHGTEQLQIWPEPVRVYYASRLIEWEVGNGGFAQAAFNIPEWFEEAAWAYEILGKPECAYLIRRAAVAAAEETERLDKDSMSIEDAFEYFAESQLSEFDEELDAVGWWSDDVRTAYVRANRGAFKDQ
jgi:uncharacterized protein DUF4375